VMPIEVIHLEEILCVALELHYDPSMPLKLETLQSEMWKSLIASVNPRRTTI